MPLILFVRGMPSLRDMKMQWTLNQFIAMDEQVRKAKAVLLIPMSRY
jgi:hypothetical protein